MHLVGPKGQVVIEKEIRERLGVEPGWLTVQRAVDGHVEIYFVPPPHNRSLKGVLAPYISRQVPVDSWAEAKEAAWAEAARVKESSEPRD